tara:strand:- start:181 stop:1062 length:882 start_codon:yes stop_codon:yes gene_type:complete
MARAEAQPGANAIRDLGYRPYVGDRLPASNNTKVLLRQSLRRAWASWLVKVAAFLGWLPTAIALGYLGFVYWLNSKQPGMADPVDGGGVLESVYRWQTWLFVSLVTLGAGACAIAEDFQFKSFQFYFAKPVTQAQYLGGRIAAVAIWVFALLAIPGLVLVLFLTGSSPEGERLTQLGYALPMLIQAALAAWVCATASVGVSSLSKSRALTMTAWILLFLVPHVLALIVDAVADWEWMRLLSIPALLQEVAGDLFKIDDENDIGWMHALPVLLGVSVGGLLLARQRLRQAEVIS